MSRPLGSGPRRVLIVDDEPPLRDTLSILFRRESYEVTTAPGYRAALSAIRSAPVPFPVVLTDLRMPDGDGFAVLDAAKERSAATEVIVMTAYHEHAYDAMRRGAYDFVSKPFPSLREVVERAEKAYEKATIVAENALLRARVGATDSQCWVARSTSMRKILEVVDKVAPARTTVLITGESGTGKERVARLIHETSDRARGPFLVVNCGALPEALMESELFGHERGAFTGASSKHLGMLCQSDRGTLLLDEIGELPLALQVKLLRVLQERKVRPVGSATETDVDVRILAATNRDIDVDVAEGTFRKDLFYRLNVIRIVVPPLRERREDLPMLVGAFVRRFASEHGKSVRGISKEAFRVLNRYPFPGNVRELENILERAVALTDNTTLGIEDIPDEVIGSPPTPGFSGIDLPSGGCDLDHVLNSIEKRLILQALDRGGDTQKSVANVLGISSRSLRYRMGKLGIEVDGGEDADADSRDQGDPGASESAQGEERELSPDVRTK